jgi:hypothetical protein
LRARSISDLQLSPDDSKLLLVVTEAPRGEHRLRHIWIHEKQSGVVRPAKSTIHAVLDRHGLVERRGRSDPRAKETALCLGQKPNEPWCTEYKGAFLRGNDK